MAYSKIRPRRDTLEQWLKINPVLDEGEFVIEAPETGVGTGLIKVKIGDGLKRYKDLPYAFDGTAANAIYGGDVYEWHDIYIRTGTTDEWKDADPILGLGEITFDSTENRFKVGDGVHNWTELSYIGGIDMNNPLDYDEIDYDGKTEDQVMDLLKPGSSLQVILNAIKSLFKKKATKNHASITTDYGVGTTGKFGHLKISDKIDGTNGAAEGVAASEKAVGSLKTDLEKKISDVGTKVNNHTHDEYALRSIYADDKVNLGRKTDSASGNNSVALGVAVTASGNTSVALGVGVTASGSYSFASGVGGKSSGDTSHTEGIYTSASGSGSHAEGSYTYASGSDSHAEGGRTSASGIDSHAEGNYTIASGDYSHAEGLSTTSSGYQSHTEGTETIALSINSRYHSQHAEGYKTTATGLASHTEGQSTISSGSGSHAEGFETTASGDYSHAGGYKSIASGNYSHAEGQNTIASGLGSHADSTGQANGGSSHADSSGQANGGSSHADSVGTANGSCSHADSGGHSIGNYSHAEGYESSAIGNYSHAEGYSSCACCTTTFGEMAVSHAEGTMTTASGKCSHSEGRVTIASGDYSHAGGYKSIASGDYSHAEGCQTSALGMDSHAEGQNTITLGDYSHAEGNYTTASGNSSHAEGNRTTASGNSSHAEGYKTNASGPYSHAEGEETTAIYSSSHAEGLRTYVYGLYGHAEGVGTSALSIASHTEGRNTIVTEDSDYSHAEGYYTSVNVPYSHAEGYYTSVNAPYSHVEGYKTICFDSINGLNTISNHVEGYHTTSAGGIGTHVEGLYTFCNAEGGNNAYGFHVEGIYNVKNTTTMYNKIHVIGNGTSSARRNAFSISAYGSAYLAGTLTQSTTADYAEYFEWEDGNIDFEDRVGLFVTFSNEDKIRIANSNDEYILGIVSGQPAVLANGDCDVWNGMVLRDEFNREIYERAIKVELNEETMELEEVHDSDGNPVYYGMKAKINPNYNPDEPYVPRSDRPEWAPIGMLGVLTVYQDGSCTINGYCKCNDNGIATKCDNPKEGYRIIKVINEKLVKVVFK